MIFLPIAQRELQVAALKRSTLWVRLAGAGAALLIGGFYLGISMMWSRGGGPGQMVFSILTALAFVAAMSSGMFFTSDALSEEKREGTLGLLFLTDLHGYDVVSGKLLAAGLRGFYMLLAALPIVGVTLLMGGVTGAAFWRTCLALVNALFVSLAAGLFVSSISREAQRALLATMMVLIFLGGAGFLIDELTSQHVFRFSSPLFTFTRAMRGTSVFWEALVVNQIIAWSLLALGCHFVARTWHDKPDKSASKWGSFAHWLKYGDALRRARLRNRLMDLNPIMWLTCRERWQAASFWVIAALLLLPVVAIPFTSPVGRPQFWAVTSTGLTLVLYLGNASQSCRFFVDARKNALLEILLSTPVTGERIIQGQWKAAWRMFGAPLVLFLALLLVGGFLVQQNSPNANPFQSFGTSVAGLLVVAADLLALTWFGMWMGLTSRNANSAAWKTILFVQVLPWIVLTFASGSIVALMFIPKFSRNLNATMWMHFLTVGIATVGSLAIDWWLYRFARRKLSSELAQRAAAVR